jgi:transposase
MIENAVRRGRNAMAIYQDLVSFHGFTAKYASVRRFVRMLVRHSSPEARAVIQTAPGEEAQVDYGTGPMVRDPKTGKYRRTRLFVLTLGYSRKAVRLLTFQSSSRIWAELHEEAFRRLGATPKVVVLDNLKEGVLRVCEEISIFGSLLKGVRADHLLPWAEGVAREMCARLQNELGGG